MHIKKETSIYSPTFLGRGHSGGKREFRGYDGNAGDLKLKTVEGGVGRNARSKEYERVMVVAVLGKWLAGYGELKKMKGGGGNLSSSPGNSFYSEKILKISLILKFNSSF